MKWIVQRQVSVETDMLDNGVLIDRRLLAAKFHEVAIRVIAETQGLAVDEIGRIGWHCRPNPPFQHDINRLFRRRNISGW